MKTSPSRETARFELKFVAAESAYHDLQSWIRQHPDAFVQPFPCRRVNNVYFDRLGYDSYLDSVEGLPVRTKIRYRWYGDSATPEAGQLEVKLRRHRLGWKQSYAVEVMEPSIASWAAVKGYIRDAIPAQARWWLVEYGWPVVLNRYDREYWVSRETGIRVTLDRGQSIYDQRYAATINTSASTEIPRTVVLEIKGPPDVEETISKLVADLPMVLSRNSKYCSAVAALCNF